MTNRQKPIAIIEQPMGQWRLQWADGSLSEDFYNLTRARDICKNYDSYRNSMERRKTTEDYIQDAPSEPREGQGCV